MVFHEITPQAIASRRVVSRDIDDRLVDAQETRRILDRLYGYEVSPVLWKKVLPRLSAGRVQSVATRIVVERERARMRIPLGRLLGRRLARSRLCAARMATRDLRGNPRLRRRRRVATSRDFDPATGKAAADVVHLDEPGARGLAARLGGQRLRGRPSRGEAVPAPAVPAVHDVDAAAGSWAQAALVVRGHHAGRAAVV